MGGEYLPGYLSEEIETGRIGLASTTSDVISILSRFGSGGRLLKNWPKTIEKFRIYRVKCN